MNGVISRRLFALVILVSASLLASPRQVRAEQLEAAPRQNAECQTAWEWTLALANGDVITRRLAVPAPLAAQLKDRTADDLTAWFRTLPTRWSEGDPLPSAPAGVPQTAMDDFVVQFLDYLDTINRRIPAPLRDQPGRFAWRDGCGRLLIVLPPGAEPPAAVASTPQVGRETSEPESGGARALGPRRTLPRVLSIAGFAAAGVTGGLAYSKDSRLKEARRSLSSIPPGPGAQDQFDAGLASASSIQRQRNAWRAAAIGIGAVAAVTSAFEILRDVQGRQPPRNGRSRNWTVSAQDAGRLLIFTWRF